MQEYGTGRFSRKHSSFYGQNMRQLGLSVEPEFYFDICPWQTLAIINLEFIFSERRRNYLKFAGGLCYFEVSLLWFQSSDCGPDASTTIAPSANT